VAIASTIFHTTSRVPSTVVSGFQDAFWALIVLALLGAFFAFVLLRGTKIELPETEAAAA
jgi:hypothetical protein